MNNGMKPRERIALPELEVLVSLLVKFWNNNHGDSFSDIWKPTWWPNNIRFTYPIRRHRNISPAMWRKDLVTIITNYYYTTRNRREHLNGRNVLNNSDFLWEIQEQMLHNNNNNATVIKPKRSNRKNSIQLSENTLKRLMPRLEVRLVDILATDEYRKYRENSQQGRQNEFLRNLSLITVPEYDNMHLGARYTFRASTKMQSDGQRSSPMLQVQETETETISTVAKQNEDLVVQETNGRENNNEQQNNEEQITVEEEIITLHIEPILVDKSLEKTCLQEKQVDSSCEDTQSLRQSTILMEKADCSQSSSKVGVDLDELPLKERVYLLQCSLQENQVDLSCEEEQSLEESTILVEKADCSQSSSKVGVDLDELPLRTRVSLLQCSLQENQVDLSCEEEQTLEESTILMEKADLDELPSKTRESLLQCSLQENQVDLSCEEEQSLRESTILVETADCSQSSSKVDVDLDELSLKTRMSLHQCSPASVQLNKYKASNERKKKRKNKRRVLQPRRARMISRLKINSSYIRKRKNKGLKVTLIKQL